jgi:ribonuclease P protein component
LASRSFVLLVADQPTDLGDGTPRLGITVSRRVGAAVRRNRVKRRLREWFRRRGDTVPHGKDLVVIALPGAATVGGAGVRGEIELALRRLQVERP